MPELPDVETFKRYLDSTSLKQAIQRVHALQPAILKDTSAQGLGRKLKGHRFERTRRHGKYLFVSLNKNGWIVMHFGMTGRLKYFKDSENVPEYTNLLFEFKNGFRLAYIAPRKLGMVSMVEEPEHFIHDRRLGPDALSIGYKHFRELAGKRRGNVKSWLMDQKSIAGIGNIYSDEILFQAGINSGRMASNLSGPETEKLFGKMREVLRTAIKAKADPARMPARWLLLHRKKGKNCPRCGVTLMTASVSGRTAYYCPKCQANH